MQHVFPIWREQISFSQPKRSIELLSCKTILIVVVLFFYKANIFGNDFENSMIPVVKEIRHLLDVDIKDRETRPIVAIAGCSAVGKSYFTRELAKLLKKENINVFILKVDDFLQPDIVPNYLIHKHFKHTVLHDFLQKANLGEEHIAKEIWDYNGVKNIKEKVIACLWEVDIILFEGIYTLCDETSYDFLKYSSFRIFIDAADEDIVQWNWERELARPETARSREQFEENIAWDMKDYHETIRPMKKYADLVIEKPSKNTYELLWNHQTHKESMMLSEGV